MPNSSIPYRHPRSYRHIYPSRIVSWSVVTESAAWGARGWSDVATLTKVFNPYSDVTASSDARTISGQGPRMWLAGGGYMGQKDNSIVSKMIGYVDMWFSSDGATWYQVEYAPRSK